MYNLKKSLVLATTLFVSLLGMNTSQAIDDLAESLLYYEIGGGRAFSGPPSYQNLVLTPGALSLSLTNSCGNFNLEDNFKAYFDGLASSADAAINGLIYAAQTQLLNNLILYIIRRANPNLADMLEGAMLRYEQLIQLGIKSCEQAREEILNGENPFYDYIKIGKKATWDEGSATGQTIAATQTAASARPSCINWVDGEKRLCPGEPSIKLVSDVVEAGYEKLTEGLGDPIGEELGVNDQRLKVVFPDFTDAVEWITDAFGEFELTDVFVEGNVPSSKMGRGVMPSMFQEAKVINDKLIELTDVNVDAITPADQELLTVPGLTISVNLLKVIQEIEPADMRISYIERISTEFALLKTMEKLNFGRRLIHTGLMEPNIAAAVFPLKLLNLVTISNLDKAYEVLNDEYVLRQRIANSSAQKLITAYGTKSTLSRGKLGGNDQGKAPEDGGFFPDN